MSEETFQTVKVSTWDIFQGAKNILESINVSSLHGLLNHFNVEISSPWRKQKLTAQPDPHALGHPRHSPDLVLI